MKKLLFSFCLVLLSVFGYSQGLDSIHVEVYYVSNAADAAGSVGVLPVNSVTYRLYAYMQPGYKLQGVYGVPGHEFHITSTTTFFNNEDHGATTPSVISNSNTPKNSVMLDSWFSMGGNAAGKVAVPKSADTDGALVNSTIPPILQNNDPWAGIPINQEDGMIAGTPPTVTFVGLSNTGNGDLGVFADLSQVGGLFTTSNGTVAVLGGVMGPDSANNRVLIGQFTTDGVFCYKMHIQIGTPLSGVENYVADSAVGNEIVLPSLQGCWQYSVGIPQQINNAFDAFSVYPNPADEFVTLAMNNPSKHLNGTFRIYDVAGKMILSKQFASAEQSGERVDISTLKSGIYFVEAVIDGSVSHQKFVKN